MTSLRHQYKLSVAMVTLYDVISSEHAKQCMPCSAYFSVALLTDILSIKTLDFLKKKKKKKKTSSHLILCLGTT